MSEETDSKAEFAWAQDQLETLIADQRSCILGTSGTGGSPLASYAPTWADESRRFHVYVSAIAPHYAHLRKTARASVMLIEDEAAAENLFARKRLTMSCAAELLARDSAEWNDLMERMQARLGSTMASLRGLLDFGLFRLVAESGRLVLGFGKAYEVSGPDLRVVDHAGGGGHRSKR